MNYITFDIETYNPEEDASGIQVRGRLDTSKMRASVIGAYISWMDEYIVFFEDEVDEFMSLLKQADLVVGYNHLWFDLPVLQKYVSWDIKDLHSYDIMLELEKLMNYKPKLDDIAKNNLGIKKTDSYATYRTYHLEGKWFELSDYCMNDVLITEKIFQKILKKQPLKYKDMLNEREVTPALPVLREEKPEEVDQLF